MNHSIVRLIKEIITCRHLIGGAGHVIRATSSSLVRFISRRRTFSLISNQRNFHHISLVSQMRQQVKVTWPERSANQTAAAAVAVAAPDGVNRNLPGGRGHVTRVRGHRQPMTSPSRPGAEVRPRVGNHHALASNQFLPATSFSNEFNSNQIEFFK